MNRNSKIETEFRFEAMTRGYKIFSKGYPDYIIIKDKKVIFVECKKPQKTKSIKMGFSKHQTEVKKIFEELNLTYKTYRNKEDLKKIFEE